MIFMDSLVVVEASVGLEVRRRRRKTMWRVSERSNLAATAEAGTAGQ